jgi:hypothetical protein
LPLPPRFLQLAIASSVNLFAATGEHVGPHNESDGMCKRTVLE